MVFEFGFGVVGIVVCCGLASLFSSGVTSFTGFEFWVADWCCFMVVGGGFVIVVFGVC